MGEPSPPVRHYLDAMRRRITDAGDDPAALLRIEGFINNYLQGFRPIYGLRDELRAKIAELQGPVVLPSPSRRTVKQEKIARCPRCKGEVTVA